MNHKYWLLLGLCPLAPALSGACSAAFRTCEERYTCAPGGAGGVVNGGSAGTSAGEAGEQDSESMAGRGGSGAVETAGGAAGETAGDTGEGGEGGENFGNLCTPNQPGCDGNRPTTCNAQGTGYLVAKICTNQTCVASGTAASCMGSCEPAQKQCAAGNSTQSCTSNGTWSATTPCAATTPVCTSNTCQTPVSCNGLAANCGTLNESCCTSPLVKGGPFKRDNDVNYPATVSDFRLDKYEVTVGRFRKFVAAVVNGWSPGAGSGKHTHLNGGAGLKNSAAAGYETGWDTAWSADELPTNKATWDSVLGGSAYQTWSSSTGSNETIPINRVTWFKAVAFCIWDGGFLPSEAEWNYAAVGGSAQRAYPWGAATPGTNANLAVYGCYLNGAGTCSDVTNIAPVGSIPLGNGLFGQADLAGNVAEWTIDGKTSYTSTCDNCANLDSISDTFRARRGGSFNESLSALASTSRTNYPADWSMNETGFRCARIP